MKKNLIIFLNPHIWDVNIWQALEIDKFKKKFNIALFELGHLLNKQMVNSFPNKVKSKNIIRPKSLDSFKLYIFSLFKKYKGKKILLVNGVNSFNLKSFLLLRFLSSQNINIIHINNPGIPTHSIINKSFYERFSEAIDFKYVYFTIRKKAFNYLFSFLNFKKFYYLISGTIQKKEFKNSKKINGVCWDFNKKKISNFNKKKNFAVYVQSSLNTGDAPILGPNQIKLKKEEWLKKLNKFFDELEKKSNLKIVISAHPKSHHNVKRFFKNRQVYFHKTQELIYKSKLVLIENSSAISFVIKYLKPALMIYSNQHVSKSYYRDQFFYISKLTGIYTHNVEHSLKTVFKKKKILINKKKYRTFQKKYLGDSKFTNYKIIKKKFFV